LLGKLHRSLWSQAISTGLVWEVKPHCPILCLKGNEANHFVSYCHTPLENVYLIVDIDDIVITRNDATKISQLKEHLCNHFQTQNLEQLKYFLCIKVAQSTK